MNARKHVSLMFHKGALIDDPTGLLEGDGKEARTAKFANMEDVEGKREALQLVTRLWIEMQDDE